ncbi:MAG: uracil-DNA glycosylase [Clostridia bacterium]
MLKFPDNNWKDFFIIESQKPYFLQLLEFLKNRMEQGAIIYPAIENIFNCFRLTDKNNVKIVILGQDPYHQCGQAMGLSFSVPVGVKIPPSLQNIYKEITTDLQRNTHNIGGDLTPWAKSGVLLLNSLLTVEDSHPMAHKDKGWEIFTNNVIAEINNNGAPCVFMLWGNPAKTKLPLIDRSKHLVLTAAHPSPLSAYNGFFGCKHFSIANEFLSQMNITPISW